MPASSSVFSALLIAPTKVPTLAQLQAALSSLDGVTDVAVQDYQPLTATLANVKFSQVVPQTSLVALADQLQADLLPLAPSGSLPDLEQPGLLLMDMDSTAIQIECIDELAALAGIGHQVADITARAMRGELDFRQSLAARVALLEGQPATLIDQVADNLPLSAGVQNLCRSLQHKGWKLAVASGGFVPMVERLQQTLKLDAVFANTLEVDNGYLTGKVSGAIVDAARKAEILNELRERYQLPRAQVIALGDGANDLPMLAEAGLGVACHAKPKVRAAAQWSLSYNALDALLPLLDAVPRG